MRFAVQNDLNRYIISGDQPTPAAKLSAWVTLHKKYGPSMKLNRPEPRTTAPSPVISRTVRRFGLAAAWLCFFLYVPAVHGQADIPLAELKKKYQQSIEDLRTAIKAAKRAEAIHFHVESDAAFEYRELWEAAAADAEKAYAELKENSVELFLAEKNPDEDLVKIVRVMDAKLYEEGKVGKCYDVTQKLLAMFPDDEGLEIDMGRVAILHNDFETAASFADGNLGTIAEFPAFEKGLYGFVEQLKEQFSRELELREAEAKADDLPRVELETTKGKIVIELFENEAPDTVGNFVNLVEIGFYDEMIFHPTYDKLLAQTGMMTKNQLRPTGYTIYDEVQRKDARDHFRGSVCMATEPDKTNVGSSIFYILHVPAPHIVDRDTVFGRVISGMDVVDSLQPTKKVDDKGQETTIEDIIPDTILSAKVIRKRDHEYVPNRVKEKPETSQ